MIIFTKTTLLAALLCILSMNSYADVDNKSLDDYLKKLEQGK